MIHQADETINITYDKKKPGTKLLECYVTIYTGMFAVVPLKQMGNLQGIFNAY
jgi:sialic acid synthase SpsE